MAMAMQVGGGIGGTGVEPTRLGEPVLRHLIVGGLYGRDEETIPVQDDQRGGVNTISSMFMKPRTI